MAKQIVSSAMQLSTFTKVTTICTEKNYRDFPVIIRVKAPQIGEVHQHAPVDIVAVIDVSGSMGNDNRLVLVKQAMAKVIENLAGDKNRLAVVAFSEQVEGSTELLAMTEGGQQSLSKTVTMLKPYYGTKFSAGLNKATEILDNRQVEGKDRLAFIIFLSDGSDTFHFQTQDIPQTYPIHTFGISAGHDPKMLQAMADLTSGSYTPIIQDLDKITEKLDQLSDKLTSIIAVGMHINLKSLHSGVFLSKIGSTTNDDAGDSYQSKIGADKQSGEIFAGAISSGKEREFTVYLDVPEGQGNNADGSMDLLMVGGVYTQSWDQKQVALSESIVTVVRPPGIFSSCKELDWIEERLKYWCKVKQDLSGLYDKADAEAKAASAGDKDGECECQVTKALREASQEAINKAMYHDTYTAVLHALKLRQCRSGSKAAVATAK